MPGIGRNTLTKPRSSRSMKLKKDQISLMEAKLKDMRQIYQIRNDQNDGISAKYKLINKVFVYQSRSFKRMLGVEGR